MKIVQRIRNVLTITCQDVNFLSASNIEVYVKQDGFFASYVPTVLDATSVSVTIPLADAKRLNDRHTVAEVIGTAQNGANGRLRSEPRF